MFLPPERMACHFIITYLSPMKNINLSIYTKFNNLGQNFQDFFRIFYHLSLFLFCTLSLQKQKIMDSFLQRKRGLHMKTTTERIDNFVLSSSPLAEINYQRTYSIDSLILLFFTFSGIGWIWEVIIHIFTNGMIINRGILAGPWLPIYGAGGVLILLCLKKWQNQPVHLFGMIMLLCGIIEYATSVVLEKLFGLRWWDYKDMPLQIHGRVCVEGLLVFGLGGLLIVYLGAPLLDNQFQKLSKKTRVLLCGLLLLVFAGDMIYSFFVPNIGFGITT